MSLHEDMLWMVETTFPSRARDFLFVRLADDGSFQALNPLEVLALDRTAKKIAVLGRDQPPLALVLALCRLLVPSLQYRGSGRHLVVEPWSLEDLCGQSLVRDVPTTLARELSAEQAEMFRAVTAGEAPPTESLAELFWQTQTNLPALPAVFEDADFGKLAKALYFHVVPEGQDLIEAEGRALTAQVEALRKQNFVALNTGISSRKMPALFRKLLAVTVRYSSQLTGSVVEDMINERLHNERKPALTEIEKEMLAIRYGACRALNDINLGFLFGCGYLLADRINEYFLTLPCATSPQNRLDVQEQLRADVFLLSRFQQRRKQARADERFDYRQRHADAMPQGPRHQAEYQANTSVAEPPRIAEVNEEMARLHAFLPALKERDARRLRAFLDCQGDRKAAAEQLGIDPRSYSRQLRQTVFPAIRELARQNGWNSSEGEEG